MEDLSVPLSVVRARTLHYVTFFFLQGFLVGFGVCWLLHHAGVF